MGRGGGREGTSVGWFTYIRTYMHNIHVETYVTLESKLRPRSKSGQGTTPAAAVMPSAVPRGVSTRGPAPASDLGRAFLASTRGKA